MAEAKKAKRVLKAGYKRVKTTSGGSYYINERTGNRVKKATATRASKKRSVHRKRVVHRKRTVHRKRAGVRRH